MKKLLLGLALAGALAACQPLAPAAAPAPALATGAPHLTLPEAYTERGVLPRATDILVLKSADALEVPLQYERSVEETLVWEGDGQGVAELYNQHGQLIYRVKEGEPAQTVTVGAGRHTLRLSGASTEVLSLPELEAASSQSRRFERLEDVVEAAVAAAEAEDMASRGPVYITNMLCERASGLRRELESWQRLYRDRPSSKNFQGYIETRARLVSALNTRVGDLRRVCPEVFEGVPPQLPE